MSKLSRRKLKRVSIGSFNLFDNDRRGVEVDDDSVTTTPGALYDTRMGHLDFQNKPSHFRNSPEAFGRMGYIPLKTYILNPVFEKAMLTYLSLFQPSFESGYCTLKLKDGIGNLIEEHRTLSGYRRLKAIAKDSILTNPWKLYPEGGGVRFVSKKEELNLPGRELREVLIEATERYTSPEEPISLYDLGLNPKISKPEDFVRGDIPVLPNLMRAPRRRSDGGKNAHPFTTYYASILRAVFDGNIPAIRTEWLKLIKNGNEETLKSTIFTSNKEGFIRGSMYAKVGGQVARSVVAPNPRQRPDQVGIPRILAKDISYRVLITEDNLQQISSLIQEGRITHVYSIKTGEYIRLKEYPSLVLEPHKMLVLRELQDGDFVLINRQPSLHKNSILGFEVYLHDEDVIYIHNSATKSFGMDFDGDESNCYIPYSPLGQREVRELMFVEFHLASLASSSLLVGYHQDVNLAAHILSMEGTFVPMGIWEELSTLIFSMMWKDEFPSLEDWLSDHQKRCKKVGIEPYSGKSLYSILLPRNFDWSYQEVKIRNGILYSGLLESKTTSASSGSIGMRILHTLGSKRTLLWLNTSYRLLNRYLILRGITLGISSLQLSKKQKENIDQMKETVRQRSDLRIDTDLITNPILKERKENEIVQELSNVREKISMEVINPTEISIAHRIQGKVVDELYLGEKEYSLSPNCDKNTICLSRDPKLSLPQTFKDANIDLNFYSGEASAQIGEKTYRFSLGLFPHIKCRCKIGDEIYTIDRRYTIPDPLLLMMYSGARGNSTNAIQIAGIIGQQSYGGGRIPRMLGSRSMPCYPFETNTPRSRGFIANSYLQGMHLDEFMSAHVASRENLTSNTDLTPRTGYFERKVRTFTENLRISSLSGKKAVTNEKGVIVMTDYILDPSKLFSIQNHTTFIDVNFELQKIRTRVSRGKTLLLFLIPYRRKLEDYIPLEKQLLDIISKGDAVCGICDPLVRIRSPDFYSYLGEVIPDLFTLDRHRREKFYLSCKEYDSCIVVPLGREKKLKEAVSRLRKASFPPSASAILNVSQPSIDGYYISSSPGKVLSEKSIFDLLTFGTSFDQYPFRIRTGIKYSNSLLESLIAGGEILSI